MDTPISQKIVGLSIFIFIILFLLLSGCSAINESQSPYLPPNPVNSQTTQLPTNQTPIFPIPSAQPIPSSTFIECSENLQYVDDLTIPDWATIKPGIAIDKQWKVENNGTCDWDYRYSLRMISGESMSAENQQALFPARAGSQAIIQISFIAPLQPGTYHNVWQAYNPNGQPFGDPISILVVVAR